MTRTSVTKTSFTAGELDPLLLGRLDLKAQEDGAARLRNVVAHPTGGVSRRPGLRLVRQVPGAVRLVAFDGSDGGELLAFGANRLDILKNDAVVFSFASTLWNADQAKAVSTARWGHRLFLCHPDVPPHELVRPTSGPWVLRRWAFETDLASGIYPRELQPFAKFTNPEVFIDLANRSEAAIEATTALVRVWATEPIFRSEHPDSILRVFKGSPAKPYDLRVVNVDPLDPQIAYARPLERIPDGKPTRNWAEQAFSQARGWPATVTVHQERLVVGGSRDLPDRVWFSRTGPPLNFDPGGGLADEAFSFRLVGDEHHAVRALVAGRQLQVLTTAGEWVVQGRPLSPETVEAELQTRIGSPRAPRVEPVDVDGATLFVGASGRELREFLFAESEQAYQAADVALLSRHLLDGPAAMAFDRGRRWLLVVRQDGRVAVVAVDRNSNVLAWSLLETVGSFLSVAVHRGEPHFLVKLGARVLLERFDAALGVDHAVDLARAQPTTVWNGLDHLEGQPVLALTANAAPQRRTVASGTVVLGATVPKATFGAPFAHAVESLPLAVPTGSGTSLDRPYRPVRVVFRLAATGALRVDTGSGWQAAELPPGGTGEASVRALGWRRGSARPPWRVEQDDPSPCTILSVTTEIKGEA
jgi:hypothetical protein